MKLMTLGRRSRAAAQEPLTPLEAALQPAVTDGRWRVPERFNFTRDVVEVLADESRRAALRYLGPDGVIEPWSFRELAEGAGRWAAQLREHGVRPGDRVLVLVGKSPTWIEVMLAGMKVGAVTVPCSPALSAATLGVRLAITGAKAVVAERTSAVESLGEGATALMYVEDAAELPERKLGEEPTHGNSSRDGAFVLTTSGADGGPYGVEHTHAAAFAARAQAEHWLDARRGDVVWCTTDSDSPLTMWCLLLGPWSRGAEIVLHEGPFDPEERLDLIRRFEVTILCQTPSEYRALAETGEKKLARYLPERLRRMVAVGDYLSSDVVRLFEQTWGLPVEDGYAQTECGVVIGHGSDLGLESGSIGHALPGYDLAIVDENGNELPPGSEGQLAVRGRPPSLFSGYWNAPEETKAAFRGDLYLTGDVATVDEEGAVWLLGRAGDVITSGGRRFSPFEVEQALIGHRSVVNAGVVGIRDLQRGGQYVRAFVVLAEGVEGSDRLVAEIRQHLRHSLPEDMVPREVEFVDALPSTPNGKILRRELRDWSTVATHPVWQNAPRLPGTPAPVTTFEPEPEPPVAAAEEGPLPDFVVPSAETYAAPMAGTGGHEPVLDAELEDEFPDYIVMPELVPEVLPEHVVSFLNAEPLPNIPVPPEPKPKQHVEPRTEPILKPAVPGTSAPEAPAAATKPVVQPEPQAPPAKPVPAPAPAARAVPRPLSPVEPPPSAAAQPKSKPRKQPVHDPEPSARPVEPPEPVAPAAEVQAPPPPAVPAAPSSPSASKPPPKPPAPKPKPAAKAPPQPPKAATRKPPKPAVAPKPASPPKAAAPAAPAKAAAAAPPRQAPPTPKPPPPPPQRKPAAKPAPAVAVEAEAGKKKRGLRRRKEKPVETPAEPKRQAAQRSAPEPGMENTDVAWLKGFSSRLSAYGIAPEDAASSPDAADQPRDTGPDAS